MARQREDSAAQIMQRLNFDPLKKLVYQANELEKRDPMSSELREICLQLMPFAHAKLKKIAVDELVGLNGEIHIRIGGGATAVTQLGDDSDEGEDEKDDGNA